MPITDSRIILPTLAYYQLQMFNAYVAILPSVVLIAPTEPTRGSNMLLQFPKKKKNNTVRNCMLSISHSVMPKCNSMSKYFSKSGRHAPTAINDQPLPHIVVLLGDITYYR